MTKAKAIRTGNRRFEANSAEVAERGSGLLEFAGVMLLFKLLLLLLELLNAMTRRVLGHAARN